MSKERSSGKSGDQHSNVIKHILRSGKQTAPAENHSVKQRHECNETVPCETGNSKIKTKEQKTKYVTHNPEHSITGSVIFEYHTKDMDNSNVRVSLRRSPRCKHSESAVPRSDKVKTHRSDIETFTKTAQGTGKYTELPRVNTKHAVRRFSSPVNGTQNTVKKFPCSSDKNHSPRVNRRSSYPQIPLRVSPRRKSPVKYFYGNACPKSPKRKTKSSNYRRHSSLSPQKKGTDRSRYDKETIPDSPNEGCSSSKPCQSESPKRVAQRSNMSSNVIVRQIKKERNLSPVKSKRIKYVESVAISPKGLTNKTFKQSPICKQVTNQNSTICGSNSEIPPDSTRKAETPSATERELKKIRDYWSPKQTALDSARLLRNGRSLQSPVSPMPRGIKIKQEPVNEFQPISHSDKETRVDVPSISAKVDTGISSVRREIQFDTVTPKRKCSSISSGESTTEDEDCDSETQTIPRRKKLRSEITNEELWEGLQIQRFKRLTPKKEKIETHTFVEDTNQMSERISDIDNKTLELTVSKSYIRLNVNQDEDAIPDFTAVSVKLEPPEFDDENPYDPYGMRTEFEMYGRRCQDNSVYGIVAGPSKTGEYSGYGVSQVTSGLALDGERNSSFRTSHTHFESESSSQNGRYVNIKTEDTDEAEEENILATMTTFKTETLLYKNQKDAPSDRYPVSEMSDESVSLASVVKEETKSPEPDDIYRLFSKDLHEDCSALIDIPDQNTSSYNTTLDVECDNAVSQTLESERDLEDTLMYDFPSPTDLEQSQPHIEFHVDVNCEQEPILPADQYQNETKTWGDCSTVVNHNMNVHEILEDGTIKDAEVCLELEETDGTNSKNKNKEYEGNSNEDAAHIFVEGVRNNVEFDTKSDHNSDPCDETGQPVSCEEMQCQTTIPITQTDTKSKCEDEPKRLEDMLTLTDKTTRDKPRGNHMDGLPSSAHCHVQNNEQTVNICDTIIIKTPIKSSRPIADCITPKRSARLQEKRENTPSKLDDEYIYTPLKRVDGSPKTGERKFRTGNETQSRDTHSLSDNSNKDQINFAKNLPRKLDSLEPHEFGNGHGSVNNPVRSSIEMDEFSREEPSSSKSTLDCKDGDNTTTKRKVSSLHSHEKHTSVSTEPNEHPPLKIRVKKSADGTTEIIASPSSKSAMYNYCIGRPEVLLTPCDKKKKSKDVPMRSILKPNTELQSSTSNPNPNPKRKRSRPSEVNLDESDVVSPSVLPVQSNRKKKEGTNQSKGQNSSRRHQSGQTREAPLERGSKSKSDDTQDLLKNSRIGKHASILWLSENRRHFLLKHSGCSPSEIDALLIDAWKNLGEKERLKYYHRATGAMKDENKHSNIRSTSNQTGNKDVFQSKEDGPFSKKMLRFLSLSPMEQHEELRRWLRFFVYEVSPAEYAKLMADFKETMKDLKEKHKKTSRSTDLEMQALYRKILFQKILNLQDKIVDIYHQKREKQNEIVKEGFNILTKQLIVGADISFSNSVRSDDLEQVLLDLRLLENDRRIAVSGTPLKSKSYENVLEQLHECELETGTDSPSTSGTTSGVMRSSPTRDLPEANSQFAKELLMGVKGHTLHHFEPLHLERVLDLSHGTLSTPEMEENVTKEIFEELSKFFDQEALHNHDMNFWAPMLSARRNLSTPSSVLTDSLLADQFKMLARNPSVFGSGVRMLIDPNQLKPFLQGTNKYRSAPRIVQYPSTVLRYSPSPSDRNTNCQTKRRTPISKYDKYKTHSVAERPPVTVHYAGRARYPTSHVHPRMQQRPQMHVQTFPRARWPPPQQQTSVCQPQGSVGKEADSRFTSIIHRRIQNVEGGSVVRYTATSMGRRAAP